MATQNPTAKRPHTSVLRMKPSTRSGTKAERIAQMRREGFANARKVIIKQYPDLATQ